MDLNGLGYLTAIFLVICGVYWVSTRKSPRSSLSISAARSGITRLQRRIDDLAKYRPSMPSWREVKAKETTIENALTDTFGEGTREYEQYQAAARLTPRRLVWQLTEAYRREELVGRRKLEAIKLLSMAVQDLQDKIPHLPPDVLLPKETLHPSLSGNVWTAYTRREFDSAAFQAMKAVEVAVRDAGGFSAGDIGTSLMREAFKPKTGPLADAQAEGGEQQACSDLFAGAIGSFKNPQSHRDVKLDDPDEAAEIIMLANHLLRIVEARQSTKNQQNS
jgi:uncharacterized protein (TIGR02391 family)